MQAKAWRIRFGPTHRTQAPRMVNHKKKLIVRLVMRYSMTFALPDRPGQLLRVLEPIARAGGNIVSIIHERDKLSDGYVPVNVVVEFPENFVLEDFLRELRTRGFLVFEVKEVFKSSRVSFIVVGPKPLSWIFELAGPLSVSRVEADFSQAGQHCVKVELESSEEELHQLLSRIEQACEERGCLLIKPI